MDWLVNILKSLKTKLTGTDTSKSSGASKSSAKKPIFEGSKRTDNPNEIKLVSEVPYEQAQIQKAREKYVTTVKNPDYKVRQGDNPDKIAQKYGVTTAALLAANGLTAQSARNIKSGQVLKIPPSKKVKNVKNLSDVAKALGVSAGFIKNLKQLEDSQNLPANKFHNTPYIDQNGVKTIGIGHRVKSGEKTNLSDAEVCTLCAKDLLKAEEHLVTLLGGQKIYDKIPQPLKESVLDLTFNKGVVDDESFKKVIYCLKTGKWEAAINNLTFNKSIQSKKEMSGLSKRRLFDIANATKMYGKNIPQSNISTAQQVYNRGVALLRAECKLKGLNFNNQLAGYNKDVQNYFGGRVKLKMITK